MFCIAVLVAAAVAISAINEVEDHYMIMAVLHMNMLIVIDWQQDGCCWSLSWESSSTL